MRVFKGHFSAQEMECFSHTLALPLGACGGIAVHHLPLELSNVGIYPFTLKRLGSEWLSEEVPDKDHMITLAVVIQPELLLRRWLPSWREHMLHLLSQVV